MDNRKGIISLIIVLVILIAILSLLNLSKGTQLQKAQIYTAQKNLEQEEKFYTHPIRLTSREVISFELTADGKEIMFFDGSSDSILKTNYQATYIKPLYNLESRGINNIIWSPLKSASINYFNSGAKKYINHITDQVKELDQNIKGVVFSKDGRKIAYHYFASLSNGNISISNPDGSDFKTLIKTRISDIKIQWPSENIISFYNLSEPSNLFSLNISNQELTKLVDPLYNFSVLWSPDGKSLIYSGSGSSQEKPSLYYYHPENQQPVKFELNTFASSCTWSIDSSTIFCSDQTGFWKIDVKSKAKENIYQNSGYFGDNLILSPLENYLVFKNKKDGFLYSLPIKD